MEGQLGFFEQERSASFLQSPKKPEKPQRTVRELALVLPTRIRTPMLIKAAEMRHPHSIPFQLKLSQLGNGDSKGLRNPSESPVPLLLGRTGQLFEEIATERVTRSAKGPIWLSNQLRNEVEVLNLRKERSELPKLTVCGDLFEVGLCEPALVLEIGRVGTIENHAAFTPSLLPLHGQTPQSVLIETKEVSPFGPLDRHGDVHYDVR